MSFQDANASKPEDTPKGLALGMMTAPNTWSIIAPGTNFCIFTNPDPTTPQGKIPLVFVRVESNGRKLVFMCGCTKCISGTKEDRKAGRVRFNVFTGKWSGLHAHQ